MGPQDNIMNGKESSSGIEVVATPTRLPPMEKTRSGLDTEPSSSSLAVGNSGGITKIPTSTHSTSRAMLTRREMVLAGVGVLALIGLVVGLAVALSSRPPPANVPARVEEPSLFPESKAYIDSVCSLSDEDDDLLECQDACAPAECCRVDDTSGNSCVAQHLDSCLAYATCHVVLEDNNETLPAPLNLQDVCSWNNKSTCRKACQAAECCYSSFGESSCLTSQFLTCLDYAPCQVLKETTTLYPADTEELLEKCSSSDEKECQEACQPASCCWSEGEEDDCFQTDLVACLTYSPCANTKMTFSTPHSRVPDTTIQQVCGMDSILTQEGYELCSEQCKKASCCTAAREPYNCFHQDPFGCLDYELCELLELAGGSVPRLEPNLQETCSNINDFGIDDLQMCIDACKLGACCLAEGDDNCYNDGNQLACDEYNVCQPLLALTVGTLERPPNQLKVCTRANLQTEVGWNMCARLCQPAACCNSLGDDNCLLDNISTCSEWNAAGCYLFAGGTGRADDAGNDDEP